jgi:GNAT superfamily N-acetyltransferase
LHSISYHKPNICIFHMKSETTIRPVEEVDYQEWRLLWGGYNAFYGREQATALPEAITRQTWGRFFSKAEPVHALVAQRNGTIVGLVHYVFHRSTSRLADVCYLQDLFTSPEVRGQGIGRALILQVYEEAARAGSSRVYWTTQESNSPGRLLYDKVATHAGFIIYSHELPP